MFRTISAMGAWVQGIKEEKKIGIVRAIRKVWPKVPQIFGSRDVKRLVEKETGNNYMDTTITGKMRYLRGRGEIGYECKDIQQSKYLKLF